ncbi:hypothetical protein RhiirA1_400025 [Rhizophagus irregularis]|uniref:Uncharacterized protein n=1 Tax=Rhizophagus irregularis TaxID=588596 RepID=A0A2N0R7T9_9GLOM|nr:hypothetical protein RhiirA1_400025 [Rhizophagus irregularis]
MGKTSELSECGQIIGLWKGHETIRIKILVSNNCVCNGRRTLKNLFHGMLVGWSRYQTIRTGGNAGRSYKSTTKTSFQHLINGWVTFQSKVGAQKVPGTTFHNKFLWTILDNFLWFLDDSWTIHMDVNGDTVKLYYCHLFYFFRLPDDLNNIIFFMISG